MGLEEHVSACSHHTLSFLWGKTKQSKTKKLHLAKATAVQLFAQGTGEQAPPPVSIPGFVVLVHHARQCDVE